MFGTKITDEFFGVHTGGDVAFLNGVLKVLLAIGGDRQGVRHRAHRRASTACSTSSKKSRSTISNAVGRDARRHGALRRACTAAPSRGARVVDGHHAARRTASTTCSAIVNLALARGNVGRPGAGLMPIRGHSGVQGGAEMGCYATAFPGGVADRRPTTPPRSPSSGASRCRRRPASTRVEMVEAARRGDLDVLWSSGGNFLDVLPAPDVTRTALARTPLRVHQDIVLTHQMLVEPGETVVLLPAATRYEQARRRHVDDDRTARRVQPRDRPAHASARREPSATIFLDVARRVHPERADRSSAATTARRDPRRDRARRARVRGHRERCARPATRSRSAAQRLCEGGVFPTPDGRAHFSVVVPHERRRAAGPLRAVDPARASSSTRWCGTTSIRSPARRATRCSLSEADAAALGVADGRRGARAIAARRDARARAPRADPARQRAGVLPRGERAARAEPSATRSPACPTTTRVVEVVPVA